MLGSGLLLGAATMAGAGRLLVRVDPFDAAAPADVVYVVGGSRVDRWLEAVEIYKAGGARRILISRGGTERAEAVLASQGIIVPTTADMARTLMVDHLGVPADAVEVLRDPMDNTAHEAVMIEARARRDGWTRIVVITTRAATRRAGYAFRRVLGDDIQIVMRDTRYDDYDAVWWWRTRGDFRQTFIEFPKLMAYWLGLGA